MRIKPIIAISALAVLQACGGGDDSSPALQFKTLSGAAPLVIGHRGASGELPEHTLESYERAIARGADFIEPDLVLTSDGVMIARHEPMLDGTTDVAVKFPGRQTTKVLDGVSTTAYFASDFTLAEIKTLRAIQARAGRSTAFDGLYGIPTLAEVITLAQTKGAAAGRTVGIYPEIKHSTFHAGLFGANVFEDKLVATLHPIYGNSGTAPVFIQSFEVSNLQYLNTQTDIRLVQLIDADDVNADGSMSLVAPFRQPYDFVVAGDARLFSDLLSDAGLTFVKTYADAVGPWKPYLVKTVNDGVERTGDSTLTINDRRVDGSTGVIEAAHAKGLLVHTWTFRDDASGYGFKDPKAEMQYYMKLGIDGVFTDFPATGVAALKELR
ncbi:glycerophosphoryl diester phosphodiesterase [Leptothrix cholodnii SP-6]|uniref:glycerophosphodiester phosphodiesterase n=1 Tax=Leptothrix cholodnii (strain ATCC 51168 / LMG 8142 / SP-6) TaxID=395495 RepID=B1Y2X1_LEPCP|nr:glycerophosphodiester phosphodiesterase [Leptothrix cholodnii]ACB35627.1 glycerophosphoryl diester phosphodiesterase [Leptothrix cholodnii SP-6]